MSLKTDCFQLASVTISFFADNCFIGYLVILDYSDVGSKKQD